MDAPPASPDPPIAAWRAFPEFSDAPKRFRDAPPRFVEAADLVGVGSDLHRRPARLIPEAAAAWSGMRQAAADEAVTLWLVSAFRSIARQAGIVRTKRRAGQSWDAILRVSAYPGFSEHHTGRAIDVVSPGCPRLVEAFSETPEFAWLENRAGAFGFSLSYPRGNPAGVDYEPWHWCWNRGQP